MKKFMFFLTLAGVLFSCQNHSKRTETVEDDTLTVASLISALVEDNFHSFEGIIPAADAQGIRYNLQINDMNDSYTLQTTYLGADNGNDRTFVTHGTRKIIQGTKSDPDAIVYQLIPNDGDTPINLVVRNDSTLRFLTDSLGDIRSEHNYDLTVVYPEE
ncbi:MAG: copper resistance protein NlpE [Bacteroides sp.]|nr:copper resistance protein NlpE [Bacteroides sp.]